MSDNKEKAKDQKRPRFKTVAVIAAILLLLGISATEEARHILCEKAGVCIGVRPVFLGHGGFPTPDD